MKNTFDTNPNGSGNYVVALRTGGYMQAAGTAPIYTQYDWLEFKGTGTFSPSLVNVNLLNTANPNPLKLQVANQATATYLRSTRLSRIRLLAVMPTEPARGHSAKHKLL
jgi:hypothetical protein